MDFAGRGTVPVKTNVVLIGMPGVGKSTVGVLLAKRLNKAFVDTDVVIQAQEGRFLQEIIDRDGLAAFRALEERYVLSLARHNHVIATGGSVVYSRAAMEHLQQDGRVVYLYLPLAELVRRVTDMGTRGLVIEAGQTFAGLFAERQPLYEQYGAIRVDCSGQNHEQTVEVVEAALRVGEGRCE